MSKQIAISLLDRSPWADLFDHPEEHIAALAEDIKERGIQTPIQVYPLPGSSIRYEMLTGHDRVEAAKRVGLKEVPCEVRSTLNSEDDRFRHFIADNTHRKDINKRRMARTVIERYPDWSLTMIARLAACSVGLAHDERQNAEKQRPELFKREKSVGTDGVERPAKMPPREPKLRTDKPEPRSAVFPVSESTVEAVATKKPEPASAVFAVDDDVLPIRPSRIDRPAETKAIEKRIHGSAWNRLTVIATNIAEPGTFTDAEIDEAVADPDFDDLFLKAFSQIHALSERVIIAHETYLEARLALG